MLSCFVAGYLVHQPGVRVFLARVWRLDPMTLLLRVHFGLVLPLIECECQCTPSVS